MSKKKESEFRSFINDLKDKDTSIIADGLTAAESSGTIDTGCYMLNALISGSIYGGLYNNKRIQFAGESSTGKTFFALSIVKGFLDEDPRNSVFYYDTETAVTVEMMAARGIDVERVAIVEKNTIEEFRTHALKVVTAVLAIPEKTRPRMLFVLDSLGNLSSKKELGDIVEGNDTRDMTKSQLLKGTFRSLSISMAKAKIPLIINNHTYAVIGSYVPTKKESGGSGARFISDIILFISKKVDKELKESGGGNIIVVKVDKSRFTREKSSVELRLSFQTGLDKYYGLLDIAKEAGIIKKVGNRYELPDGSKFFEKEINKNPEKVFTKTLLDQIDELCKKKFLYGTKEDSLDYEDEGIEDVEERTTDSPE